MSRQLYLQEVTKRLGISSSTVNKLALSGELPCNPGGSRKRTWPEETISRFSKSERYKKLSGARCVILIHGANIRDVELHKRKALIWCQQQGYKSILLTQVVKANQTGTTSFRKAVEEMRNAKTQSLLYFGVTEDIQHLTKCYQSLEYVETINLSTVVIEQEATNTFSSKSFAFG